VKTYSRWILAALATGALLAAGCSPVDDAGDPDAADLNLINPGTLVVCTDVPYPPFEFEDPDAPSGYAGFDIDIMQEVADRLDLTLEVVNTGFDPIESGIAMTADECDIAAAAMTITDDRAENINFTDPYFDADQSLLAKDDSGIGSLDDLAGMRLGVQSATTGEQFAEENAPDDTEIVSFENPGDLFTALDAGEIDAILQDLPVNERRAETDDSVSVVEEFPTGESYGFGAKREGKEGLVDAVNQILADMEADGTYTDIFDVYFGGWAKSKDTRGGPG
jgi:polar amino acid transport system substrate-binding protein